jgi:hypothetical protein
MPRSAREAGSGTFVVLLTPLEPVLVLLTPLKPVLP